MSQRFLPEAGHHIETAKRKGGVVEKVCAKCVAVSASVCKTGGRGFESRPGLQFDHTIAVILVALFYLAIGFPL
jgi:hypothetical protein